MATQYRPEALRDERADPCPRAPVTSVLIAGLGFPKVLIGRFQECAYLRSQALARQIKQQNYNNGVETTSALVFTSGPIIGENAIAVDVLVKLKMKHDEMNH